jgi:EAL domain-containing protein (putative c-di-GMP-specific phosphodiesterase class I)
VDLATGRRAAVEALLRIRSGKGELLTPAGFLHVAEETGLIVSVGAGTLDVAAQQVMQWTAGQGADVAPQLSVNVSGRQLAEPHMAQQILSTLGRHGLAPSQLCLELAEGVLIDAGPTARRTLQQLKELGVVLAVDDFGTGRSSLAYLRRFAIDALKIDRFFLRGLGHDDGDTEVIKAVVGLGQVLGLTTIAKGVETAEQAEMLRDLGCQQAQGFYFGRPSLPEDLVAPIG